MGLRFLDDSTCITSSTERYSVTCYLLPVTCYLLPVQSASARDIYAKAGFPGAGVGYAHSLNEYVGVRADFSSAGTLHHHGVARKSRYAANVKARHLGAYADWFPFGGSFRLSGGLHSRTLEVIADSDTGTITVGKINIPYGDGVDAVQVRTQWPRLAPYLGIGWGHHVERNKGFGLIADLGVSFGSPRTELTVNAPLRRKLDFMGRLADINVDAEIERQRRELADEVDTVRMIPHLFVGISYHF